MQVFKLRKVLLLVLVATFIFVSEVGTSKSACGQQGGANRQHDNGSGDCVDGRGVCAGAF
jgi:hypothetical protein